MDHPDRQYLQEALAKSEEFCIQVKIAHAKEYKKEDKMIYWYIYFLSNIVCIIVGEWRSQRERK